MVEVIKDGDIFASGCQVLVNPVNCVGVCGKGLALEFKKRFPNHYKMYKQLCEEEDFKGGDVHEIITERTRIWFAFTKQDWRQPSRIEWIEAIIKAVAFHAKDGAFNSIAIPALGCGEGGLDWNVVKPLMLSILEPVADKCTIKIYEPR